jgi:hypothetical protein
MHQSRDLLIDMATAVTFDINFRVFLRSSLVVFSLGY